MDAVERLAPWMYEFDLPSGVRTPLLHDGLRAIHAVRRSMIFETLDAVGFERPVSVLDLGCSEGFFSFEFAKRGATDVRGIDARERNIEKANLVRAQLGFDACRFEVGDATAVDVGSGTYDVVLLLGLIYHVEDPIRLIRRAGAAARRLLVLETQLAKPQTVAFGWGSPEPHPTDAFWAMHRENPSADELSSIRGFSLIPSVSAVVAVLREMGFASIAQLHPNARTTEQQYIDVDRAIFFAWW